jgi:starch phosphorylase
MGADPVRQEMSAAGNQPNGEGARSFRAEVPSDRPAADYTARIMPRCDGLAVPLEADWILWQK